MNTEVICSPGDDAYEVQAFGLSSGSDFWYEAFSNPNDAGVTVNAETALGHCHVWKALNVLAGDLGQLPVKLYRKEGDRPVEVRDVPEIDVLRLQPNPWTSPSVWKETAMWVAALRGNSLSWIRRPSPKSIQLIPLRQDRVRVDIDDELTGGFHYIYRNDAGTDVIFDQEEILHIQGLASNGIWGIDLLTVAKNCIGQGIAIEKYVNRSFKNNARPGGVLKHPGALPPDARANLRREWESVHAGGDNAGKIAILWEGMDYMQTALSMEQAQVEELKRLDRQFVASLFNLPLFKLNSLEESATRSNLEQQQQEYVIGSLTRWLNRFAEEFNRKLLPDEWRRAGYYYRWVTEALLRGDTQQRYAAYATAIQSRFMSPNEARAKEDMPPYDGGDDFGNPNIEPVAPEAANDADNAGGRPPGSEAADRMVADGLRRLIDAECKDVRNAASRCKNFTHWVDVYYAPGGAFYSLVSRVLLPVATGVSELCVGYDFDTEAWAGRHAAESKLTLLNICGKTTQDRLTPAVKMECETWNARASQAV